MQIKLEGFAELQRKLHEFGDRIAAKEQANATRAAAVVFRDAMRETAPVRTGFLRANVVVNKRRSSEGKWVVKYGARIKPGRRLKYGNTAENRRRRRVGKKYQTESPAFYARFLEYGSSKMLAKPFIRPSFGPNVQKALDAFEARMRKGIDDAMKQR
jgi:HK97 gp10 family phage protein